MKRQELNLSLSPQKLAAHLTEQPGIYMFCAGSKILYIGKARNLRKRVSSYLHLSRLDAKSRRVMERADNLSVTLTRNNTEALVLEQNLIKEHHPPYNIVLRDNKSYPYIFVSQHKSYPLIAFHRGPQKRQGSYYGPFPHASSVHQSIDLLQKIFKVRSCTDSFFANRARPCLQYQIGRCSAPCVRRINENEYQRNIHYVQLFLQGKSLDLIKGLSNEMQQASDQTEYEKAAALRNKITSLRHLQEHQYATRAAGNLDAIAVTSHGNLACVYLLFVRQGKVLGSQHHFFRAPAFDTEKRLLADFLTQYYLKPHLDLPNEIVIPYTWKDKNLFVATLERKTGTQIKIIIKARGDKRKWLDMAKTNSMAALSGALKTQQQSYEEFNRLRDILNLPFDIKRIECFDTSHSSGEATQTACVVFTPEGNSKRDYRRYNITNITKGDDYAALKQAITRRYQPKKQVETPSLPQIILIDGGRGQLNTALHSLENLQIKDIYVIAIAKGEKRAFGYETFYLSDKLLNGNEQVQVMEYSSHHSPITLQAIAAHKR